ncbi:MAG: sulfite reductase subunit alpha [Verrucomicrobia bacterium]|nr:sulfite reductase subunit alpha [Verrucomicrobiota bacterium]
MSASVPQLPESAPFTPEQRAWLNGFFAGIFNRQTVPPVGSSLATTASALVPLTILYGTQTGTAESLAKKAAKVAGQRGFAPAILDLGQTDAARLAAEKNVLLITSTYGDGEPPDAAKPLHTALREGTHALAGLRYSVCALGDTNYTLFCQAGKDFDAALEKHGATRIHPRADCDVDYDAPFESWLHAALSAFGPVSVSDSQITDHKSEIINELVYSKSSPFPAPVLAVRPLNAPGSAKEVNHIEFDLTAAGSALTYEAGDALGVIPRNDPALVSAVLAALGADGEEAVSTPAGELPLRRALTEHYDLGKPTPALLEALGLSVAPSASPPPAPSSQLLDVLDALLSSPAPKQSVTKLVTLFRKIAPRLYSISSSPKAHPGHVHLTVGAVRYEHAGRTRKGVCSTFLAERALAHGTAHVFIHANKAFRPPADPAAPMIMVGPGTGIAPFRAFLEERAATQAPGKNWLFFGDQKAATDFLYREELEALQRSGVLTRLDLAFSRDQAEKIYVQHRMLAAAAELFAWLEQGAYFYVCGDASRMAKDVDAALHQVIETAGSRTPAEAAAYVQALRTAKHYQRDVY